MSAWRTLAPGAQDVEAGVAAVASLDLQYLVEAAMAAARAAEIGLWCALLCLALIAFASQRRVLAAWWRRARRRRRD